MPMAISEPPPQIVGAIKDLWAAEFQTEQEALGSARFRMLARICSSLYPNIPASRLPSSPTENFDRDQFNEALSRFFRWEGAPWYPVGRWLSAERAAEQLHHAFLLPKVKRTYLVPLDQLALEDCTKRSVEYLRHLRFGKCEIILLEESQFVEHVPVTALKRFEPRHWIEPEKYAGFHYIVASDEERAGPIWERSMWGIFHVNLEEINKIKLYDPVFPETIEDALFIILLCLLKDPPDGSGKPFAVPWVYSFTDDPFSEPPQAPDPSALSWDPERDVPDRPNYFSFTTPAIEKVLAERWSQLEATRNQPVARGANFHLLTKHFFMKAFQEEGVDEIIALISCVEATLMLPDERYTDKLLKRYKKLVNDDTAYNSLKLAYAVRNKYLHSLGDQRDTTAWEEFAKYRWAVAKAVDYYLTLAGKRSGEGRETLLRSLKR